MHKGFWWDFIGKIGAPIFAASLVGCLLAGHINLLHGMLMGLGFGLIALSHWYDYHRKK